MRGQIINNNYVQWICKDCETVYFQVPKGDSLAVMGEMDQLERKAKFYKKAYHKCEEDK